MSLIETQKKETDKKRRIKTAQKIYRHLVGLAKAALQHWTGAEADFVQYGTSNKRVDKR